MKASRGHTAARTAWEPRSEPGGQLLEVRLKLGAVVVDVGINIVEGRPVGDVDYDSAARVVSAVTPVTGGVGPLTNAILLTHLMRAARNQAEGRTPPGAGSLRASAPAAGAVSRATPIPAPSIPTSQPAR
jgi:hypothetical protein